jgi:hypothetical protein
MDSTWGYVYTVCHFIAGEDIALIIHDTMHSFLMWICVIAAVACFICGILEKEDER